MLDAISKILTSFKRINNLGNFVVVETQDFKTAFPADWEIIDSQKDKQIVAVPLTYFNSVEPLQPRCLSNPVEIEPIQPQSKEEPVGTLPLQLQSKEEPVGVSPLQPQSKEEPKPISENKKTNCIITIPNEWGIILIDKHSLIALVDPGADYSMFPHQKIYHNNLLLVICVSFEVLNTIAFNICFPAEKWTGHTLGNIVKMPYTMLTPIKKVTVISKDIVHILGPNKTADLFIKMMSKSGIMISFIPNSWQIIDVCENDVIVKYNTYESIPLPKSSTILYQGSSCNVVLIKKDDLFCPFWIGNIIPFLDRIELQNLGTGNLVRTSKEENCFLYPIVGAVGAEPLQPRSHVGALPLQPRFYTKPPQVLKNIGVVGAEPLQSLQPLQIYVPKQWFYKEFKTESVVIALHDEFKKVLFPKGEKCISCSRDGPFKIAEVSVAYLRSAEWRELMLDWPTKFNIEDMFTAPDPKRVTKIITLPASWRILEYWDYYIRVAKSSICDINDNPIPKDQKCSPDRMETLYISELESTKWTNKMAKVMPVDFPINYELNVKNKTFKEVIMLQNFGKFQKIVYALPVKMIVSFPAKWKFLNYNYDFIEVDIEDFPQIPKVYETLCYHFDKNKLRLHFNTVHSDMWLDVLAEMKTDTLDYDLNTTNYSFRQLSAEQSSIIQRSPIQYETLFTNDGPVTMCTVRQFDQPAKVTIRIPSQWQIFKSDSKDIRVFFPKLYNGPYPSKIRIRDFNESFREAQMGVEDFQTEDWHKRTQKWADLISFTTYEFDTIENTFVAASKTMNRADISAEYNLPTPLQPVVMKSKIINIPQDWTILAFKDNEVAVMIPQEYHGPWPNANQIRKDRSKNTTKINIDYLTGGLQTTLKNQFEGTQEFHSHTTLNNHVQTLGVLSRPNKLVQTYELADSWLRKMLLWPVKIHIDQYELDPNTKCHKKIMSNFSAELADIPKSAENMIYVPSEWMVSYSNSKYMIVIISHDFHNIYPLSIHWVSSQDFTYSANITIEFLKSEEWKEFIIDLSKTQLLSIYEINVKNTNDNSIVENKYSRYGDEPIVPPNFRHIGTVGVEQNIRWNISGFKHVS